jgi:putative tryptophan/tyrosine transport system substrate-binding protein
MRRRDILVFLIGSVIWSAQVRAQQSSSKISRVAFLYPGTIGDAERPVWEAFLSELGSRGYIEGKNFVLHRREASGRIERVPALIDELITLRPDVIVVVTTSGAVAAQHATATIPIVMWGAVDPVGFGLVSSLARPGGNITGTTAMSDVSVSKAVELLHLLAPAAHRLAVLISSGATQPLHLAFAQKAAEAMGLIVVPISAPTAADLDSAFAEIMAKQCDALLVPIEVAIRPSIPSFAAKSKIPAVYQLGNFVDIGGLASYGASQKQIARRTAYYVDKILKGTSPSDLPVEEPVTFELAVNLKTAAALGLAIPDAILARADRVIE